MDHLNFYNQKKMSGFCVFFQYIKQKNNKIQHLMWKNKDKQPKKKAGRSPKNNSILKQNLK